MSIEAGGTRSCIKQDARLSMYSWLYDFSPYRSHSTYRPVCRPIPLLSSADSRQSSTSLLFLLLFLANRSFVIFTNLTPWASLAMASLPPPTARRRPFRGNGLVSHIMGDSPPARFDQIHRGGEIYITTHQGDLRGLSLPQHGATNIASTTTHGRKTPVLGQRA